MTRKSADDESKAPLYRVMMVERLDPNRFPTFTKRNKKVIRWTNVALYVWLCFGDSSSQMSWAVLKCHLTFEGGFQFRFWKGLFLLAPQKKILSSVKKERCTLELLHHCQALKVLVSQEKTLHNSLWSSTVQPVLNQSYSLKPLEGVNLRSDWQILVLGEKRELKGYEKKLDIQYLYQHLYKSK